MTRNKDQKRLIRTRMAKTGEAYTAARAQVLAHAPASETDYAAPRAQWPKLAGHSDAVIKKNTGHTWRDWVAALDAAQAHRLSHRDIARHIAAQHPEIDGWWTQTVTVGYERIRGLRAVGQRRDGAFEASKSRTFAVDMATLFAMFEDARRRKHWLGDAVAKVRTATAGKSMRVDWHDGTQVHFYFTAKGADKSAVNVQHVKLGSKADAEASKAFWAERLDALDEWLRVR